MRVPAKPWITAFACGILLPAFLVVPLRAAGEVIDRIVATVNGQIILQSDLDEGMCYEALVNNRKLGDFNDEERRAVLDRLIDQELLREQMKSAEIAQTSDAEVAARAAEIRKLYPEAATDEGWKSVLSTYHLSEKDFLARLRRQIELMRLVDAQLRPKVEIDSKSVEAYYREQFVPKLKESGASEVPLDQVSGKIRELLTEQKVGELLVSWLRTLRSEGSVNIPDAGLSIGEQGAQAQ